MDDLHALPILDELPPLAIRDFLAPLLAEVAALRSEVAHLRRENLELRQQVGYWKSRHADAVERLEAADHTIEQLRGEVRQLKGELFGRRSEKAAATDRSNDLDDPQDPKPHRPRGQQRNRPGPPRRDYSHLPAREEWIELPEEQRRCSCCGRLATACGTEDSEQVEIETTVYRRVIHRRRYRRVCDCPGPRTQTAPEPAKLIPKSRFGTSVWVDVLLDKFATHRPTERLLADWRSRDFDVAAGTLNEGLQRIAPLFQPIYDAMCERNGLSKLFQADETRWKVFEVVDGKTGHTWWLWVFLGADTTVYILDPTRSHDVPEAHVGEAEGTMMVDRYSAYKAMPQVKDGRLVLAFCWAHVRRDFVRVGKGFPEWKDWALTWLRRIRNLYRINALRGLPANPARTMELRDALAAMQRQARGELADPERREPVRKVLTSLMEHWDGLTLFVDDPRIPMDNNRSERAVRGPALGRKNYYGSGAVWSGKLAAMMFSLFATLAMGGLNPRRWLQWYLESCAASGGAVPADARPFLPWNLTAEQRKNLAEVRGIASESG